MKSMFVTKTLMAILMMSLIIGCSDEETSEAVETAVLNESDLKLAAQVDNTDDQSFSIIENAYVETEEISRSQANSFFPSCAVITISPDGNGGGSILVDFGDGCTLNNGAEVSGQVQLVYGVIQGDSRTITYTYEDFTHNGNNVSGGGTLIRQLQNTNGNPQSQLSSNVGIYFPDEDVVATRTISRTREWIEGVGTGTWTDNVVLVTGEWDTTFSSGFMREGEVIVPLRREATCPHFVSGILDIEQNRFEGQLDFGDGSCDNIAVATINDREFIIRL